MTACAFRTKLTGHLQPRQATAPLYDPGAHKASSQAMVVLVASVTSRFSAHARCGSCNILRDGLRVPPAVDPVFARDLAEQTYKCQSAALTGRVGKGREEAVHRPHLRASAILGV